MRNISEYPITKDEKIAAVEWAIKESQNTQLIGSIRPAALLEVLNDLKSS